MNSGKTILIAGGTGMVGQALVKHLLIKGFEIKILTRNIEKAKQIYPHPVVIHKWPSDNEKILFANSKSCEAIINLSGENIGEKAWTKKNKQSILESRMDSVNRLFQITNQIPQKPKVWVQASAIGYYGFNTIQPTDEKGQSGDGFLASVVKKWEDTFLNIQLPQTKKVILRFGIVMSEKGGFLNQMKKAANIGIAIYPGNGYQNISWIHIDDLVEIIYQSIINPNFQGVVNVVSPNPASWLELAGLLKKHTFAMLKIGVPAIVFRLLFGNQKANEMVLANQNIIPKKLLENEFSYSYNSFDEILK